MTGSYCPYPFDEVLIVSKTNRNYNIDINTSSQAKRYYGQ